MPTEYIAIVDDNAQLRKSLARLLERYYSYRVQTYGTAREFIESLRLEVPACLILDLRMEEMTGDELQHYLEGTGTRIPTVILTAHDESENRERCQEAGAVAFLVKPVAMDNLTSVIAAALGRKEGFAAL